MKKIFLMLILPAFFLLCACVHTGEIDSLDFVAAMAEHGYDCRFEEVCSAQEMTRSCYIGNFRLSLDCNESGAVTRLRITYSQAFSEGFLQAANAAVSSLCGFSQAQISSVFDTLMLCEPLPETTLGIRRCETEFFMFSFSCDAAGGMVVCDNTRLNPSEVPTVTVRTTVPSAQEAEASP